MTEAEAAKTFCSLGGTVVAANAADLRAPTRAVQPVYDQLELDAKTKNMIERVRALKRTVQVPAQGVATPCRSGAANSTPPPPAAGDQSVLDGTYRIEITQADLRSFGVTNPDDLAINEGVLTWTLKNGRYIFDQKAPQETDHQRGKYTVAGNRVTFYLSWVNDLPLTFTWQIADRTLAFQVVGSTDPILTATFTAHPWTKIG